MVAHPQFKGESRLFLGDIALLITQEPFKLSRFIRPVCINDLNSIHLYPGSIGEIAGWGVTEIGLPSEELKALEIPYKDEAVCDRELPLEWAEKYDIIDKMCAGFPERNISVCKGDSGSGLSFKNIEDNRYYVHGIVSLAPTSRSGLSCNIMTSALYTRVSFYYEFIDVELNKQSRCRLPNHPRNGKWIIEKSSKERPGNNISPFEVLKVICDEGYELTTSDSVMDCETLVMTNPTCRPISNVAPTTTTTTTTTTTQTPSKNYANIEECGRKVDASDTQKFVDGEIEKHLESPWVAGIFVSRRHTCTGSILSKRLVVTAARSVSTVDVWTPISAEAVTVTTGKYYSYYADPRDPDAQYYGVEKIFNFDGFKGIHDGLYGDIGFLVIQGSIEFNKWVKPICVQGVNSIVLKPGDILEITGWTDNYNMLTEESHTFEVVFKTVIKCVQETSGLGGFISPDAICGGSVDSSVCVNDHGSGLVYKNPADQQYYLAGIFAFSLTNCVKNNTFYVNTKYHYDYIIEQINKYY